MASTGRPATSTGLRDSLLRAYTGVVPVIHAAGGLSLRVRLAVLRESYTSTEVLAAIVPATDNRPTLGSCIAAITSSERAPEEVIVVREPPALSVAGARNQGVARSTADIVVFVDSDVIVARDAFARIREHFERDPDLTAVFGAYDDEVATAGLTARFRNLLHHHVHTRSAGEAGTFWAGIGAVRRDAFEQTGGFDEARYPRPSIEDVELGIRLVDAGARIRLDPMIRGTHLKEWTLWQMLKTDFAARGMPWVHLLLERRELPAILNLGWRERLSAVSAVCSAILALRGRFLRAAACAAGLVALNRPFYRVLRRRLGTRDAFLCVPLHIAHHVAGAAALPAGLVTYLTRRRRHRKG